LDETLSWLTDDRTTGEARRAGLFDKYNVHDIWSSSAVEEQQYSSRRMIVEPGDYKGLNFRGVGWEGFVVGEPEFGASGIVMASADVYTALQTGVIDACEVGSPFSQWTNGFQEVCKYAGFPGVQQLTEVSSTLIAGGPWKQLTPDIQSMIDCMCNGRVCRTDAFNLIEAAKTIDKLEANGNVTVMISPNCQIKYRDASFRIASRLSAKDANFKENWQANLDYMTRVEPYLRIQTRAFGTATLPVGPFKWSDLKQQLK